MTNETVVDTRPPAAAPPPRRRWLPAVAVAAAVVAIGIGVFSLSGGDNEPAPPVDEIGASPLDTATLWIERYQTGDVSGYEALMAEDATFRCVACASGADESGPYLTENVEERKNSGTLGAAEGSLNAMCSEVGSTVNCDIRMTSAFGFFDDDGQPINEYEARLRFTVENGSITSYERRRLSGNFFDYGLIAEYDEWLENEDPAAHDELFAFGTLLISEPDQIERHREFVAQWVATR